MGEVVLKDKIIRNKKKKSSIVFLLVTMVFLSACGKKETKGTESILETVGKYQGYEREITQE